MKQSSQTNHAKGVIGEERAMAYLAEQGYDILRTRYKTKYGEIDLVAQKDNLVCFVEVKRRPSYQEALESVDYRTRKRIENSALHFISEYPVFARYDMRFDVIAITGDKLGNLHLSHLDNAWLAGA